MRDHQVILMIGFDDFLPFLGVVFCRLFPDLYFSLYSIIVILRVNASKRVVQLFFFRLTAVLHIQCRKNNICVHGKKSAKRK